MATRVSGSSGGVTHSPWMAPSLTASIPMSSGTDRADPLADHAADRFARRCWIGCRRHEGADLLLQCDGLGQFLTAHPHPPAVDPKVISY